jgi:thiol-disulfide isomerase/thioredoxin
MNSTLKAILVAILAIAVLVGAWYLYRSLTSSYRMQQETSAQAQKSAAGSQSGSAQTSASSASSSAASPAVSSAPKAADFTVYDEKGNKVSLSDYLGKPVVVNFWASWCGYCKLEMPEYQKVYEAYGKDVQFLMVDLTAGGSDTKDAAAKVIAAGGYTFPVFYDDDSSGALAYSVRGIPRSLFIDQNGVLVSDQEGAVDGATLEKLVKAIQ